MSLAEYTNSPPAMLSLLAAYHRWQKEEGLFQSRTDEVGQMQEALGLHTPVSRHLAPPPEVAFLATLPLLDVKELSTDDRFCGICHETFDAPQVQSQNTEKEAASRLPCGHVFGICCLSNWIDPRWDGRNNTYPYCRRKLFNKLSSYDTPEGLQARLDVIDWFGQNRENPPLTGQQDLLRSVTRHIVRRKVQDAFFEQHLDLSRLNRRLQEGWLGKQAKLPNIASQTGSLELQLRETLIKYISKKVQRALFEENALLHNQVENQRTAIEDSQTQHGSMQNRARSMYDQLRLLVKEMVI